MVFVLCWAPQEHICIIEQLEVFRRCVLGDVQ